MKNAFQQSRLVGKRFLLISALLILVIWGVNFLTGGFLSEAVRSVGVLIWSGRTSALSVPFSSYFSSRASLTAEIERLQKENEALKVRAIGTASLEMQNETLRSALARGDDISLIGASVLVWPPQTPYGSLIIDAGTLEGITVGQQVLLDGIVALGVVSEVSDKTARLTLFSAPGNEVEGLLPQEEGMIAVTLTGQGAGAFEARVPRGVVVSENSYVLLPGIAGFVLGRVSEVIIDEADPFKLIRVARPVSDRSINVVGIQQ